MVICCLLIFFLNQVFRKNSFRNIVWVSYSLDQYQARHFVGSDLVPNCLQRLSADHTSRYRVKKKVASSEALMIEHFDV